jgi:opacity protein-like surface antigen
MTVTIITDIVTAHRRAGEIVCASVMWYKASMRRLTVPLVVVLALLVLAPAASAEWFLEGYLGPAITTDGKLEFTAFGEEQRQNVSGRSSPSFGVRVGKWLDDLQWPWLGVAFDVSYFRPSTDVQTVPLSLLLMLRYGFLKDEEFPGGRLQPYVGVGPGLFISHLNGTIGAQQGDDTSTDIGVDARVGVAYRIDSNWAAFTEYRFTHVSPSWSVDIFAGKADASNTFNTHHILLGVSYRF